MRSDPDFEALLRQLLDSGVAPKYVARLTAELEDHYDDLKHEACRAGVPPDDVDADARERLGRCEAIAFEFERHPELRSWIHTSRWLAAAVRALAGGGVATRGPGKPYAAGPEALVRYTAAGAAGTAVTATLLLSMVVALSPESIAANAMTRALRSPAISLKPPAREASVALSRAMRPGQANGGAAAGAAASGPRGGWAGRSPRRAGSGAAVPVVEPRPAYGDTQLASIPVPPPELHLEPAAHSARIALDRSTFHAALLPAMPEGAFTDAFDAPRPIVAQLPTYPRTAERLGLEGHVVVEYTVSRSGEAEDVVVVEASQELFKGAALAAAREFRFVPRIVDGRPVDVPGARTTIRFILER